MIFPKINLHIHSYYSDGKNTIEQIIKKAQKLNYDFIAITDHFSDSWKSNIIKTLDSQEKIQDYLDEIHFYNNYLKKSGSKLRALKGIEIDLGSSFNIVRRLVNPQEFNLILFEYLETYESIAFIQKIIKEWKNNYQLDDYQLIFGLAHFDPSNFLYDDFKILLDFLRKYNIYIEFNSNYPQYYSTKYREIFYDKLIPFRIPVATSSDSHYLSQLDGIDGPLSIIEYYELNNNYKLLLDKLEKIEW